MFDESKIEAIVELILSGVALAAGIAALVVCPALAPLAVPAIVLGAGGLIFGHW